MAGTVKTFVNNSPPQCEDADLNGFKNENNNLITGSGQALSDADNQQTHKAVSVYAHGGSFYTDGGAANAYVLSVVGSKVAPPAYFTGMEIVFKPTSDNTGASTVNVATLGVKSLKMPDGSAIPSGVLNTGHHYTFRYDGTDFIMLDALGGQPVGDFIRNNAGVQTLGESLNVNGTISGTKNTITVRPDAAGQNAQFIVRDSASVDRAYFFWAGVSDLATKVDNRIGGTINCQVQLKPDGTLRHFNGLSTTEIWSGHNLAAATRGALTFSLVSQPIPHNTLTPVPFSWADAYDTDSIHDLVTNNTRLTVPAGITRVRLSANVVWGVNASGFRQLWIHKNGGTFPGQSRNTKLPNTATSTDHDITGGVIEVTGGDYFELMALQTSGASLNLVASDAFWFAMELIK